MHRVRIFLMCLLVVLSGWFAKANAQSAQAVSAPAVQPRANDPATRASNAQPAAPVLQERYPRYRVQRSDTLLISFPVVSEFDQTVIVQPDGYITLLSAGSVHVQGLTVPEVEEALKKAYAKVLHDPVINVDLKNFQRPFIVVNGQVGKPGQYDFREDLTVSQAIGVAGGFTPMAKTQVLLYHRVSPDWVEVKKLSLKDVLHGKNANEDVTMQPGDMVFVPEKFISSFRKYVPYSAGIYLNPTTALF